jgi:hypothetical protein
VRGVVVELVPAVSHVGDAAYERLLARMRGPMATRRRPLAHKLLHCRLEEVRPAVRVREGYAVQLLTVVSRRRECVRKWNDVERDHIL